MKAMLVFEKGAWTSIIAKNMHASKVLLVIITFGN
jgi:hypothetical protein